MEEFEKKWIENKDDRENLLKVLNYCFCRVRAILLQNNISDYIEPKLYLTKLEELYPYREKGFIPTISERKEEYIVFYYEILKEFIEKIMENDEIEKFMQSVSLHELSHLFLKHSFNTEEEREQAELEANSWMFSKARSFYDSFAKHMPLIEKISDKNKKN